MVVRWGEQDVADLHLCAGGRLLNGQGRRSAEDVGEDARVGRVPVLDAQDRGGQRRLEGGEDLTDRRDAAGRRADTDDGELVVRRQGGAFPAPSGAGPSMRVPSPRDRPWIRT